MPRRYVQYELKGAAEIQGALYLVRKAFPTVSQESKELNFSEDSIQRQYGLSGPSLFTTGIECSSSVLRRPNACSGLHA